MTTASNLFTALPERFTEEHVTRLLDTPAVRIERIVSLGHSSAPDFWYDQEEAEWVVVLQGAARLRFEDEAGDIELRPGDFLPIAAHRRHRVTQTDPTTPTIWLAVFYRTADRI